MPGAYSGLPGSTGFSSLGFIPLAVGCSGFCQDSGLRALARPCRCKSRPPPGPVPDPGPPSPSRKGRPQDRVTGPWLTNPPWPKFAKVSRQETVEVKYDELQGPPTFVHSNKFSRIRPFGSALLWASCGALHPRALAPAQDHTLGASWLVALAPVPPKEMEAWRPKKDRPPQGQRHPKAN